MPPLIAAILPPELSFPKAATFPMQLATAGTVLFLNLGFPLPSAASLSPDYKGQGILIYGATSAVGTTIIQLVAQLGFTVFAVASGKHEKYVKSLGATYFFARDTPGFERDLVAQAKSSNIDINYAIDCISEGPTFELVAKILTQARQSDVTAKLANVLPWPENTPQPEGLTAKYTSAFEVFSKEPKVGQWLFNKYLPAQVVKGSLIPSPPVQIVQGGLASTQKAWDQSKGGVSATKLVLILKDEAESQ